MKRWFFEALEAPHSESPVQRATSTFLGLLILANVFAVVLESMQPLKAEYGQTFRIFDSLSVAVFTVEYLLRIWVITGNPQFRAPIGGRFRYSITPMALIDLLAILPYYIAFSAVDLRVIRVMRLF